MAGDAVISEIVDPVVYVIPNPDGLSKYIQTLPTDPLFTPEFCEGLKTPGSAELKDRRIGTVYLSNL